MENTFLFRMSAGPTTFVSPLPIMLTEKIKVQLSPLWVPDSPTYVLCPPKPTLLHIYIYIYICKKEKGRSVGRTEIGWLKRPRELPPSLKAEGRGWRAKCKWEQPTQRRQGPWCVPQTHREKAEELGPSQAHPSGLQRPQEAAGTCPVGKGVHGWL